MNNKHEVGIWRTFKKNHYFAGRKKRRRHYPNPGMIYSKKHPVLAVSEDMILISGFVTCSNHLIFMLKSSFEDGARNACVLSYPVLGFPALCSTWRGWNKGYLFSVLGKPKQGCLNQLERCRSLAPQQVENRGGPVLREAMVEARSWLRQVNPPTHAHSLDLSGRKGPSQH